MTDVQRDTTRLLEAAAARLRRSDLPESLAIEMERLAGQVEQPCVVAVVGKVNAGKSTFINALLGQDKALVGTNETTATINYFAHGDPDPNHPVRCHWRGGRVTDESPAFLDSLQGNDPESLRRADGVEFLEYLLPLPLLRRITLVDTPGTGAVVGEHEQRTDEYIRLATALRNRHAEETDQLSATADAVIYLIGSVARASDRAVLEGFQQATGGSSRTLNAVGVIAKVDLDDELLARRDELATKAAGQLREVLNTVVPVSAATSRAHAQLIERQGSFGALCQVVGRIPREQLELLLADEELFCHFEVDDCPIPPVDRCALYSDLGWEWGVFTTVVRAVAEHGDDREATLRELHHLAGFGELRRVLEQHFLDRSHLLRCFRIADDARKLVSRIRFRHLPQRRAEASNYRRRLERFVSFIGAAAHRDEDVAQELEEFVRRELDIDARKIERLWRDLDHDLGQLLGGLREANADFDALRTLEDSPDRFSADEVAELRSLLGLYGSDLTTRIGRGSTTREYVAARQLAWRRVRTSSSEGSARRLVADRAHSRLGTILAELEEPGSPPGRRSEVATAGRPSPIEPTTAAVEPASRAVAASD